MLEDIYGDSLVYDKAMRLLSWLAVTIPLHWLMRGVLWSSISLLLIGYSVYYGYV